MAKTSTTVAISMPEELAIALRTTAKREDSSQSRIVRIALRELIAAREKAQAKER